MRKIHCERCGASTELEKSGEWRTMHMRKATGSNEGVAISDLCPYCVRYIIQEASTRLPEPA